MIPLLPAPKIAGLLPPPLRIVEYPKHFKKRGDDDARLWIVFGDTCAELMPGQHIGDVLNRVVEMGKGA